MGLKMKKDGVIIMSESDSGEVMVNDNKLAEQLKKDGVTFQEAVKKDDDK